jgi:hypothetical protein
MRFGMARIRIDEVSVVRYASTSGTEFTGGTKDRGLSEVL